MKVNGSLVFDASSASEVRNLRIEKVASVPTYTAADAGRLVFLTTTNTLYYGSAGANAFVTLATGGNAYSQTDGDNLETSLGAGVNSTGVFVPGAFPSQPGLSSPTSFTNAINQIAAYANSNNELAELDDVTLGTLATGDFLRYNAVSSKWEDAVIVIADIPSLTVSAAQINNAAATTSSTAELNILDGATVTFAELNILDGATLTTTELNYVDGVTGPIQDQLDGLQTEDLGLTSLAALTGPGFVTVNADGNTFSARSLVAPAAGLTISNPTGAGDSTFALANDLAALEGLTTTGLIVRTADGSATTTTITGTAGNISVVDGSGAAGNPTLDLVNVTDAGTGTFLKFTRDAKGRVSGTTAVVEADITGLVSGVYVDVAGDTMTGNLIMGTGTKITLTDAPVNPTDAANKAYVDALNAGLSWKNAVVAATTADGTLATAYAAGQVIDGITLVAGDRILLKDQTAPAENGIYVVQASGAPVRATDMDVAAEFDGSALFVKGGTVNEGTGWTETLTVTTVGTSPVAFSQFSGGQAFVWGTGLGNTGNTVFVKLGAGIVELPSDEVGIDVVASKAVQLTGTATGDQLTFVLDGAGLEQSAAGLKISANGVTNAMILNDAHPAQADSGSGSLDLGDTLHIVGVSTQGTSVAVNETVPGTVQFVITAANASSSQRGVATFNSGDFDVSGGGDVTIKLAGVDNGQLANSSITIVDSASASDAVALGESLSFLGGSAPITTAVAGNAVTISIADADTTNKGLASFSSSFFSVASGVVSLAATLDDLTNVSSADSASTGHVLVKSAGDWQPVSPATLGGTIALGDLSDVGTAAPTTAGQALIADGTNWQATKIFHLADISTPATTWTVTHSLGQQFCNVTVVDASNEVVIPQSITFTSASVVTVTFNTAIAGKLVVMGIA